MYSAYIYYVASGLSLFYQTDAQGKICHTEGPHTVGTMVSHTGVPMFTKGSLYLWENGSLFCVGDHQVQLLAPYFPSHMGPRSPFS